MKNKILFLLFIVFILHFSCKKDEYQFNKTRNKYEKILIINADPKNGFYWPYVLYIPRNVKKTKEDLHFLIFPNNSDYSDNFEEHKISCVRKLSNRFAYFKDKELGFVGISPIFPKWKNKMGGWKYYTHALDRDTILYDRIELKRLDLQLIKMIKDATDKIGKNLKLQMNKKVFMFGFSASAHFVNRFSILHPDLVKAYAIGGFNGHLMLPISEYKGKKLIYPAGVYDYESITSYTFNLNEYKNIDKYIYIGDKDTNNDVPFNDGYSKQEQRLIQEIFGKLPENTPVANRLNNLKLIFKQYDLLQNTSLVLYNEVDHRITGEIYDDIREFYLKVKNE